MQKAQSFYSELPTENLALLKVSPGLSLLHFKINSGNTENKDCVAKNCQIHATSLAVIKLSNSKLCIRAV